MKNNNNRTQLFTVVGIIALCILSFVSGFLTNGKSRNTDQVLIDTAYRLISNDSYYNQHTGQELAYAAIRGMLGVIDDPYAELIEPQAAQNFNNTFTGQTGVVGLYAEKQADQVVIRIVFPDGPADLAGLLVGDVILKIDNVTLDRFTDSSETGLLLRGEPGTSVHLKIQRNDKEIEVDLVRQQREFVTYCMFPERIGYISLTAFNKAATQKMNEALAALMAHNPVGLIWDLRNNEGGDMQAAQDILSLFIEDGLLFTAELTNDRTVQFLAKGNSIAADIPLLVLMDKTTYSAGETCAATIAERDRGRTIGSSSYGKGVIQATTPLKDDSMLQMTIARWLSPNGVWYQESGVAPQIEAFDDPATEIDELLQKAVDILSGE